MRKAMVASLAIVVLVLSSVGVVLAFHYDYLAEDPSQQDPGAQGTENWDFWWWTIGNSELWWWSDGTLLSDVNTVVANWSLSLPKLPWREVSQGGADVQFKSGVCPLPGGSTVLGCVQWTAFRYSSSRNASYWKRVIAWINPNYNYGPGGRAGNVAHEVGHLYGLHERYIEGNPPMCATEITVMDAMYQDSGQWFHCDSLSGPVQLDKDRVTSYYSQGEMSNFNATANGSVGTYTWKDEAWAEHNQRIHWYYWDGALWIEYYAKSRYEDTGVHRLTEDRTLEEVVNRNDYGSPAGWHVACGQPWFLKWSQYGTWKCSDVIWLN